jgi:hypothetical protein
VAKLLEERNFAKSGRGDALLFELNLALLEGNEVAGHALFRAIDLSVGPLSDLFELFVPVFEDGTDARGRGRGHGTVGESGLVAPARG